MFYDTSFKIDLTILHRPVRKVEHRSLTLLLLLCSLPLLTLTSGNAWAALTLEQKTTEYAVTPHMQAFPDPQRILEADDILSRLTDARANAPDIKPGGNIKHYWFAFQLSNQSNIPNWVFSIDNMPPDYLELYQVRDNRPVKLFQARRGTRQDIVGPSFVTGYHFPVTVKAGETTTLLLRMDAPLFQDFFFKLHAAESFTAYQEKLQGLVIFCLGIIFSLMIYNLFLAIGIRDMAYGWYTLLALSNLVSQASYFGFFESYLGITDTGRNLYLVTIYGFNLFAILFSYAFLNIARLNPYLKALFLFVGLTTVAALAIMPWLPLAQGILLIRILGMISLLLFLGAGVHAFTQGIRPARFYLLAWGVLMLTVGARILGMHDIIPHDFSHPIPFLIASCLEMLLLSLALADRIVQLQHEKTQADQESQRKSRFLAAISHEIRTPLSGVLGMANVLERTPLDPRQKEYVHAIKTAGGHLLNLLNDVLDYARSQEKEIPVPPVTFNPRLLVQEIITLVSPDMERKKLQLSIKFAADIPEKIHGDEKRIRQVLLNLANNAIKFTEQGSITFGLEYLAGEPATLHFTIKDSGVGVSPNAQKKIFEFFEQADDTIKPRFGGTGIGLALARDLVHRMGGEIGIHSTEGVGSTFWFRVPVTNINNTPAMPASSTPPSNRKPLRALVADDDEINQLVACTLLKSAGFDVTPVHDGEQVLTALQSADFDLILMDLNMPVMDGITATQHIRALHNHTKAAIPIFGLTAHLFPEERDSYLNLGMNEVLLKPLDADDLLRRMSSYIARAA